MPVSRMMTEKSEQAGRERAHGIGHDLELSNLGYIGWDGFVGCRGAALHIRGERAGWVAGVPRKALRNTWKPPFCLVQVGQVWEMSGNLVKKAASRAGQLSTGRRTQTAVLRQMVMGMVLRVRLLPTGHTQVLRH
jgi:hypothetical protein